MGTEDRRLARLDTSLNLPCGWKSFRINLHYSSNVVISECPLVELRCGGKRNHHRRHQAGMIEPQKVPDLMRDHALNVVLAGFSTRRKVEKRIECNIRFLCAIHDDAVAVQHAAVKRKRGSDGR